MESPDLCLVVPAGSGASPQVSVDEIVGRIKTAGLTPKVIPGRTATENFIVVTASLERLQEHAESSQYSLLMGESYLRDHVDDPVHPIPHKPEVTPLRPYQNIYGPYKKDKPNMFVNAPGLSHPFSSTHRIRLILDIFQSPLSTPTTSTPTIILDLLSLTTDGTRSRPSSILSYYPLHDDITRQSLNTTWIKRSSLQFLSTPINEIKAYFGEAIALYFAFTSHYTQWLSYLSVVSVFVTLELIASYYTHNSSIHMAFVHSRSIPLYCIFVAFWSQFMIERWKRTEARLAMEWGTSQYENSGSERIRPSFQGIVEQSVIDGKLLKYKDKSLKWYYVLLSIYSKIEIIMMMCIVIACVNGLFYFELACKQDNYEQLTAFILAWLPLSWHTIITPALLHQYGGSIFSSVAAAQVNVLNTLYRKRALALVNMQNHRTDAEFNDSLIGKLFVFMFVNSYASLFFIAFIKFHLTNINGGEQSSGPISELAYQLAIMFGTKLTSDKISSAASLWASWYWNTHKDEYLHHKKHDQNSAKVSESSKLELEWHMEEYDPSLGVLEDYSQIFMQLGYVTLFVAACPIAPIFAYLSNLIEIKIDGYKLLFLRRRPIPVAAQDIGRWLLIMQLTAAAAVITNAALLCFTIPTGSDEHSVVFQYLSPMWVFFLFQYIVFGCMGIFAYIVEDIPSDVKIQLKRQDYLKKRMEL